MGRVVRAPESASGTGAWYGWGMNYRALLAVMVVGLVGRLAGAAMPLPRSSPEAQGVSAQAVLDFLQAMDKINTLHSVMVLRHGNVIAEAWWKPEAADKQHVLHSLSIAAIINFKTSLQ